MQGTNTEHPCMNVQSIHLNAVPDDRLDLRPHVVAPVMCKQQPVKRQVNRPEPLQPSKPSHTMLDVVMLPSW